MAEHDAADTERLPPTGRECCDQATIYWRSQYQAEANENSAIRLALGLETDNPDETLSARMVAGILAEWKARAEQLAEEVEDLKLACTTYDDKAQENLRECLRVTRALADEQARAPSCMHGRANGYFCPYCDGLAGGPR